MFSGLLRGLSGVLRGLSGRLNVSDLSMSLPTEYIMSYSKVGQELVCDHSELAFLAHYEPVLLQKDERFDRVHTNKKK